MKINTLTFYRFLAASIVVLFHYGRDTFLVSLAPGFLTAGPEMVSFFFVLSGFVMVVAYWDRKFSPSRYYRARLVRILPAYFLAFLAALFLETASYSKRAVVINALFLQAWLPPYPLSINGPSWSLSVEMFFYLMFPLLLWFLKSRTIRATRFMLAAIGIWIFTQIILANLLNSSFYKPFPSIPHDLIFYFPLSHFSTFLLGVAGGYFYLDKRQPEVPKKWPIGLGVMIAGVLIFTSLNHESAIRDLLHQSLPFGAGFFAPLFLILILLTSIASQGSFVSGLGNKGFVLLGDASYAIYIFQRPFHQLFDAYVLPYLGLSGDPAFYFYFFCLTLFSIAVLLFVEKPIKRLFQANASRYGLTKKI